MDHMIFFVVVVSRTRPGLVIRDNGRHARARERYPYVWTLASRHGVTVLRGAGGGQHCACMSMTAGQELDQWRHGEARTVCYVHC